MATSAALEVSRLVVDPGSSATTQLTVRNNGLVVDAYRCEVIGEAADWTVVEPATVSLLPRGEEIVTVTVSPPRSPAVLAGTRPLAIRITPSEQVEATVVEELELEVLPFLELTGELLPQTVIAKRWGSGQVAVDNRGNRTVQVALVASDPDQLVDFRLSELPVSIEPGEAGFAPIRIRAKKRPLLGAPITLPLSITVEPDAGEILDLTGAVQQLPRIPRWLLRIILFSGIGMIALAVMWFALLKPTLESTAREAVDREVEEAQQAALAADSAADDAGAAAEQAAGGSAAAQEAAADVAEAAAAGAADQEAAAADAADAAAAAASADAAIGLRPGISGNPFDFRLLASAEPGAQATDTFTVPEEQRLSLTDIVLQNPQGDTGTLQVRRDGAVLLETRMENFRDLDYHFVAPIVFGSEQDVGFTIICEREDGQPCRASGYFAGFITPPPPPPEG